MFASDDNDTNASKQSLIPLPASPLTPLPGSDTVTLDSPTSLPTPIVNLVQSKKRKHPVGEDSLSTEPRGKDQSGNDLALAKKVRTSASGPGTSYSGSANRKLSRPKKSAWNPNSVSNLLFKNPILLTTSSLVPSSLRKNTSSQAKALLVF